MVVNPNQHDTGAKTLLQRSSRHRTLPAGRTAPQDLNDTIDNIFFHPNVPPFISKQLIQHFVTNNPPTAYISRVAGVFRDNGAGQRGDLAAVYRAILLDPIARGDRRTEPDYGKLREPTQYVCNILRAFNALSFDQTDFSDGYLNPQTVLEGMDVFRPPSVFSYFTPGNEFQILSTATAVKRTNFSDVMVRPNGAANNYGIAVSANAPKGTKLDLSPYVALSDNPPALVDQLDALLLHGTMTDNMKNSIIMAVTAVNANNPLRRAKVAVYLTTTSWQYQVQR
jgi:uncharacterized protein (DUF1800 family)